MFFSLHLCTNLFNILVPMPLFWYSGNMIMSKIIACKT